MSEPLLSPLANRAPPVERVFVLGDSLTVGTLTNGAPRFLPSAAQASGLVLSPAPSAQVGRTVEQGFAVLRSRHSWPPTVLIALGTNDWSASASAAAGWVARARRLVGPATTLYWVNVSMTGRRYAASVDRINAGLTAGVVADIASQTRAGAVGTSRILDWRSFTTVEKIPNAGDGVHYSPAGYRLRAGFYTGTLSGRPEYQRYVLMR